MTEHTPAAEPSATTAASSAPTSRALWVGTYPELGADAPTGAGEGIWRVTLDPATGRLAGRQVATAPAPSFLAVHPSGRVLYAVGEDEAGTVSVFTVADPAAAPEGDGALVRQATVSSGGAHPCHLLLAPDARTLYAANYSSGTLAVLPLDADGHLAPEVLDAGGPAQVFGHTGSGPRADRQESPHAHFVVLAPGGAHLLVSDLGTDELRRYRVAGDGLLTEDGIAARLPAGAGPRHLVFAADGRHAYVVGELDQAVHVLAWDRDAATGEHVQRVPLGSPPPAELPSTALPSHIERDGDLLLVGVRKTDLVAALRIRPDGLLEQAAPPTELSGGWPRHLAVVEGWAVVAEQIPGAVVALAPGSRAVAHTLRVPSAACVVAHPAG
ncbi:beta-propeller fold lactonase family protein [Cellulomonas cellasea]|uniref:lactonase family protein n=1 Tax=Cellulomonas cellasea TaxID=43670 RepID=UPI0025A4B578|nr:beta-propeller fold lactonase family protein [Cellulomonas cellasea]MDM8083484.1 beta-propeller fold lactonase family protein [Cellulomonas cellasea]